MHLDVTQHRFGVNYTPTRSWYYCWNDFKEDAVAKDLDVISELGADHIRLMLIWPYFQPNPKDISIAHLERLNKIMTLACRRNLDVCVTLFVGWLSGYAFKPPYQKDDSFYELSASKIPQELYLTTIATEMKAHSNFLGFDFGNELNCCWRASQLETGDEWHNHMMALSQKCLPDGIHVNGVDHIPWFKPETFSPENLAKTQKIISLHCWTFFTGALERGQGDCFSKQSLQLPAAMATLARSYAGDPGKPVWIQEFGMSESWTGPVNIPRFLQESTMSAIDVGVNWFTWWSSHDLDTKYAFSPLEYSLGLITHDNKIKTQGSVFKELADNYRGKAVENKKSLELTAPPKTFDMDSTWQWLEQWMKA